MKNRRQVGFTLIELLVTISIAGILIAIATPSFVSVATRNRIKTIASNLLSTMGYARTEAIRQGKTISVCMSNNGTSCSGNWSDGWIVFENNDNDSPAVVDAGENVLRKYDGLTPGYALNSGTYTTHVTFATNGSVQTMGVFAVCNGTTLIGSQAVVLGRLRARIGSDTDNNGIPNDDADVDIADCTAP